MATRIWPGIPVILLDTGYLFPETWSYADTLTRRLGLNLRIYRATESDVREIRGRLDDPDNTRGTCCGDVKIRLMRTALADLDCWIAGLRREQSITRRDTPVVQTLEDGLTKVHPLAAWSAWQVRSYMEENELPVHPLWYQGYTSVGCWPCTTRPTLEGDLRSGRWPGTEKTECGIHAVAQLRQGR